MTLSGVAALEEWCRRGLEGSGVQVTNMTTSWRNGLAFCALVHRYRPDLLDLSELDPRDWRGNCALAFRLAEAELGIPALLDVEDMVDTVSPDRFSVLTYLAQFYHRLSGHDSGISSLSHSPASSESDVPAGKGDDGCNGGIRRSSSFGRQRGAIHSLMDGRRVRSRSLSAHGGRRGRLKSESFCVSSAPHYSDIAPVPVASAPPVHGENPFKEAEPAVVAVRVAEKDVGQHTVRTADVVQRSVTLREKKQRIISGQQQQQQQLGSSVSTSAPILVQQRMAKSMILESDFDLVCHSLTASYNGGEARTAAVVGPRKAGSVLSFTSVPSPYRGHAGGSRLSLLSQTAQSRASAAQLPTAQPAALPAPAKPVRTFRHETTPATRATTTFQYGGQNTWDHYIRKGLQYINYN